MWAGAGGIWPPSPAAAGQRFKAAIMRTFPQLGAVEIEHAWSGVMGFSVHGMPQIGEVIPGLWLANAFGGHGLNTSAMAGELLATAITERDDRWRLFLPYELVWAGGTLGRVVRHVGAWSLRKGEELAASLARRREAAGRLEAQQAAAAPEPAGAEAVTSEPVTRPVRRTAIHQSADAAPVPPSAFAPQASSFVAQVESLLLRAAGRRRRQQTLEQSADQPSDAAGHVQPASRAADSDDRNLRQGSRGKE
jgi:hypothetical protein